MPNKNQLLVVVDPKYDFNYYNSIQYTKTDLILEEYNKGAPIVFTQHTKEYKPKEIENYFLLYNHLIKLFGKDIFAQFPYILLDIRNKQYIVLSDYPIYRIMFETFYPESIFGAELYSFEFAKEGYIAIQITNDGRSMRQCALYKVIDEQIDMTNAETISTSTTNDITTTVKYIKYNGQHLLSVEQNDIKLICTKTTIPSYNIQDICSYIYEE